MYRNSKKTFKYLALSLLMIFYAASLYSEDALIKKHLQTSKAGDFVVTAQGKNYTLFHIFSIDAKTMTIEEITVPQKKIKIKDIDWQEWVLSHAPGHTSWVMYQVDLSNDQIKSFFSFTQMSWQNLYPADRFLTTLLSLPFTEVKNSLRKKAGPPPPPGQLDHRSLWNPPVYFENKLYKNIPSQVWTTYWPNDNTELSGKKLEVYFSKDDNLPNYFPTWIQVANQFTSVKLRIINSGRGLVSLHKSLPKQPPELLTFSFSKDNKLIFQLTNEENFSFFEVYAIATHLKDSPPIKVESKMNSIKNETNQIAEISLSCNQTALKICGSFYFIFLPEGRSSLSLQTPTPIKVANHNLNTQELTL